MNEITVLTDIKNGRVGIRAISIHEKSAYRILLNLLLAAQFDLNPNPCAEGGLMGPSVRLVNDRDTLLGLRKDPELDRKVTSREGEILAWYNELLQILFVKGSPGKVLPRLLWLAPKYEDATMERLRLFSDAIIHSDWITAGKETKLEDRVDFYLEFTRKKLQYFLTEVFAGEEFSPFKEREMFFIMREKIVLQK